MKFSTNDLYLSYGENPQVWLHDCEFTVKRDGEDLLFEFPEGFNFQKDGQSFRCAHGTIRAVKVVEEDVQIFAIRSKWKRERYCKKSVTISLEELLEAMGSYPLENYQEFYSHHEFLWSCSPWGIPRYRRKLGDKIELQVYYDHLEYEISDEYSPYEG
jgi:hypothetical protein